MDTEYNETIKVILLGNINVGKTSLCNALKNKDFSYNYNSTIGVDFHIIHYIKNDIKYKIQIWDTAGQEKFRSLVSCYFRKADIIIIMFDVSDINAYTTIIYWREFAHIHANHFSQIILIGNKNDLNFGNIDDIKEYAQINNFPLYIMSVKTDKKYVELLDLLVNNTPKNLLCPQQLNINKTTTCCVIQ